MKKLRKMDERELMMSLKICRICYAVLSLTIAICLLLSALGLFEGKKNIFLTIIACIDAITYLIAVIIYHPDKKIKDEK